MPGLGIIAGRGDLPRLIAEARAGDGQNYHVIALRDFAGDWVRGHPHSRVGMLEIRKLLGALSHAGCDEVVMAGGVERPKINPLGLDTKALSWLPRLVPALRKGDDAALRTVRALLEGEGLTLRGADEVLDGLQVGAGVLGAHGPDAQALADIERAEALLAAMAEQDVGQGCVVRGGLVEGVETVSGTDAMLGFVAETRATEPRGGVLVKRVKAGQDRKLDLPAIGVETVRRAHAANLAGISIEADGTLIMGKAEVVAAADEAGLFLVARP
ncbi:LpxI family protein [Pontivivens insulae]|uniref:Uncharacterized protein n=1 Tax=Pontivivens insulae TaxID=1639689 RepID=A0A2R8AAR9_9RHOB|nr:UDP-2,3-diacylglucosamine diphosphatase LpxI [Pontivivens insulae]RED13217.1 hypothetical protein DFR53_2353 [Pontivivens insulae]SPF29309.1 hypothetical protein POI8812_01617 [Pontivivens insulae]